MLSKQLCIRKYLHINGQVAVDDIRHHGDPIGTPKLLGSPSHGRHRVERRKTIGGLFL